jgi:hypothetical protein
MAFEDGIAATVMWMDGAQGVFTQVRKDNDEPCGLRVTFSPDVYSDFETNNPENWVRFAIGQVGDYFVEYGAGVAGTAVAGPVGGMVAASVVEIIDLHGDFKEVGAILHDHRTLVIRSEVSVSTAADGLKTLYNFEGQPAVVDDTGKEVVAAPGEAIDFRLTGPVSVPAKRDPPPEALALQALTAHEAGLTAATFEELGLVPSTAPGNAAVASGSPATAPAGSSTPAGGGSTTLLLCIGAALLIAGAGLLIVLLTMRARAVRSLPQQPGTTPAASKAPNVLLVWLSIGIAVLGILCLGMGMFGLLFSSPTSSPPVPTTVAAVPPTEAPTSAPVAAAETPASLQEPAPATTPTPSQPQQSSASQSALSTFTDDFSSPSTGWPQVNDATHMVGYSEGSMYGIALKTAGMDSGVLIPHGFQLPLHEADLYFRVRPVEGTGYIGVYYDYQDADNLSYVAVTEGTYAIGRATNGQYTSLLSSTWLQDPHIKSENGEFQIQLHAGDTVQLMVNGYTLPTVKNLNRTLGDIVIFAHSHNDSVADPEFNYQVLIDDVELKAR